ncbi:unnamed protein product [Effrenium voratum]|uniref:Uncharacterized protein n=1 Tax=Effrenium voratum TaxID=2562239 RepID=A0AA36JF95_9DINO|nr:unnamed protein product [Effrenium voratum]CAJ1426430.1 unnamed protein product [Effrenium voratum]
MTKLTSLLFLLAGCAADKDALLADDECADGQCAIEMLQKFERKLASDEWVALIEGSACSSSGGITCEQVGEMRHVKFPAGEFPVPRQVSVPANTIIEGAGNPNSGDKATKPDYRSQTVFVATHGLSGGDGGICYCQNLERTWEPLSPRNPYHCQHLTNDQVRYLRPGFLMYSNTVVKNIAYQGKDRLRPSDNGALCGGGVFETPGCVHNQCLFSHLQTGNGQPVTNVVIENVRLNDYSGDPQQASQLAVWVAQTNTQMPTTQVTVKNLVAMFLHADGINFHGFVQNALVDDTYIQNTGDDIYAVWGSHFDSRNIVFQNSIGVDAGRARSNHYGSCVAVYGAKEVTFRNIKCWAPEQNRRDCYDSKNHGETCNGCLGIIKQSFDADYSGSVFTFAGCEFYQLKRNGRNSYDLSNPQPTNRPIVCNNEWHGGGLEVRVS